MNVVVILIDTLRYDCAYLIPQFNELAERGWFFERMYGGATYTYANISTINSGLYPMSHNCRMNTNRLGEEATLCKELERAGYYISNSLDFARWPGLEYAGHIIRPEKEPFFRFCWCMNAHGGAHPYTYGGVPRPEYEDAVRTCIPWMDNALELFSDSLILMLGDHGVALEEDAFRLKEGVHDVGCDQVYDFRIRVPCVLAGPTLEHRVITESYSQADVMPTILDILGLPIPEGLDGKVVGQRKKPVFLEAQSPHGLWPSNEPNVFGATDGKLKVMLTPDGWRCYDLISDPGETIDRPDLMERAQPLIAKIRERIG